MGTAADGGKSSSVAAAGYVGAETSWVRGNVLGSGSKELYTGYSN